MLANADTASSNVSRQIRKMKNEEGSDYSFMEEPSGTQEVLNGSDRSSSNDVEEPAKRQLPFNHSDEKSIETMSTNSNSCHLQDVLAKLLADGQKPDCRLEIERSYSTSMESHTNGLELVNSIREENSFGNLFGKTPKQKRKEGKGHGVVICGHRGGTKGFEPDNSLRAFEMAIDMGLQCIELDVSFNYYVRHHLINSNRCG